MNYRNLGQCIADLERSGMLRRIDIPLSPDLEIASVQRRAAQRNGPALLFTRVAGSRFPMLGNLFATRERIRHLFRGTLRRVEALFRLAADPADLLRHLPDHLFHPATLLRGLPRTVRKAPVFACLTSLSALPGLRSWPKDGGGYITLPQVYSEDPDAPGLFGSNLGMYRIQINGPSYHKDKEAGLHYQLLRGIGPHHAKALARGEDLPVAVSVGGPPALALAALMTLPSRIPELCFAGLLGGRRMAMARAPLVYGLGKTLPVPAEADFVILGRLRPGHLALEGPFGDHLGYYSLAHEFPVLTVDGVFHRPDAVWPFTSVGRPPQEDSIFGEFVHELTAPFLSKVFSGVSEVHAVDASGVHPLLLALGSERFVPFTPDRQPREVISQGLALLGSTQTALAKYLFLAAAEDAPHLSTRDIPGFFRHVLERVDFSRDLHFITRTTQDTLDYSGSGLNQGSRLLLAVAGPPRRALCPELPRAFRLPEGFSEARLFAPGIAVLRGPRHLLPQGTADASLEALGAFLGALQADDPAGLQGLALLVVTDTPDEASQNWDAFLWTTFTRSDPATDIYGTNAVTRCKHWGCDAPLLIDARAKSHHAPVLEPDPDVEKRIDALGAKGGPLEGLV